VAPKVASAARAAAQVLPAELLGSIPTAGLPLFLQSRSIVFSFYL